MLILGPRTCVDSVPNVNHNPKNGYPQQTAPAPLPRPPSPPPGLIARIRGVGRSRRGDQEARAGRFSPLSELHLTADVDAVHVAWSQKMG